MSTITGKQKELFSNVAELQSLKPESLLLLPSTLLDQWSKTSINVELYFIGESENEPFAIILVVPPEPLLSVAWFCKCSSLFQYKVHLQSVFL